MEPVQQLEQEMERAIVVLKAVIADLKELRCRYRNLLSEPVTIGVSDQEEAA